MTVAFVGDVHGCLRPLQEIVTHAREVASTIVFLGDYVNRGRGSRDVIDYLLSLERDVTLDCHFLAGNHDLELLRVLDGGQIDLLLRMGGARTVSAYVKRPFGDVAEQLRQAVPPAHVQFLRTLMPSFEVDGVFAAHEHQTDSDAHFVVAGHNVQDTSKPSITSNSAHLDTGCGTTSGGRLTCLLWPSLEWFQAASPCDDE